MSYQGQKINVQKTEFKFLVYSLTQETAATETLQSDSEELSVASHWILPSQEFDHIWQHLYYDDNIKNNVSKFMHLIQSIFLMCTCFLEIFCTVISSLLFHFFPFFLFAVTALCGDGNVVF